MMNNGWKLCGESGNIIAVDFDGTLCECAWPEIGEPIHEVIAYVKAQKRRGAKLILWTCRVNENLDSAVAWCASHGLEFDAVNENLPEIIKEFGSDCRKVYAHEYIDDRMCPQFKLQKDGLAN